MKQGESNEGRVVDTGRRSSAPSPESPLRGSTSAEERCAENGSVPPVSVGPSLVRSSHHNDSIDAMAMVRNIGRGHADVDDEQQERQADLVMGARESSSLGVLGLVSSDVQSTENSTRGSAPDKRVSTESDCGRGAVSERPLAFDAMSMVLNCGSRPTPLATCPPAPSPLGSASVVDLPFGEPARGQTNVNEQQETADGGACDTSGSSFGLGHGSCDSAIVLQAPTGKPCRYILYDVEYSTGHLIRNRLIRKPG